MNNYVNSLLAGLIALAVSFGMTKSMIRLAPQRGWVEKPKQDRWSKSPATLYGGVAIVASFLVGTLVQIFTPGSELLKHPEMLWLIGGGVCVFAVGLRDDAKPLNPLVKLVGQVASIMPFVIGAGLKFPLSPYIFLMPFIVFWMLALSNSFNLLDNMDGLCAGTSAVVGATLTVYGFATGQPALSLVSSLVTAACLGFLFFNFRPKTPAKIFMGDCGSLFLGYMLSGLSVLAVYPSPGVSLFEGVAGVLPALLIMALPLFDTTLVVIIRKRERRAISQGGRDHSSHRLVYAGKSEKIAVVLLYGVSLVGGVAAILLAKSSIPALNFLFVVLEVVLLARFGKYLNQFSGGAKAPAKSQPSTSAPQLTPDSQRAAYANRNVATLD